MTATCDITNTGDREGTEITQLYIGFKNSKVDRPVKILRGFTRTDLKPGETKRVFITCPVEELTWYNPETKTMEIEHMDYEIYIGSSSDEKDLLVGTITI